MVCLFVCLFVVVVVFNTRLLAVLKVAMWSCNAIYSKLDIFTILFLGMATSRLYNVLCFYSYLTLVKKPTQPG